jgi:hypothetical protein
MHLKRYMLLHCMGFLKQVHNIVFTCAYKPFISNKKEFANIHTNTSLQHSKGMDF